MKNVRKYRILSFILTLCMVFSLFAGLTVNGAVQVNAVEDIPAAQSVTDGPAEPDADSEDKAVTDGPETAEPVSEEKINGEEASAEDPVGEVPSEEVLPEESAGESALEINAAPAADGREHYTVGSRQQLKNALNSISASPETPAAIKLTNYIWIDEYDRIFPEGSIVFPAGTDVVFDLDGHSITGESTGIDAYGKLEIVSESWCSIRGNYEDDLSIYIGEGGDVTINADVSAGEIIVSEGSLTVNRGSFSARNMEGTISCSGGTVVINDGYFFGVPAVSGEGGNITINGGTFESDYELISTYGASLTINGGSFSGAERRGDITYFTYSPYSVIVNGGYFKNGTACINNSLVAFSASNVIPDGYELVEQYGSSFKYRVAQVDPTCIARIGETKYPSLKDAVDAVQDGGIIRIYQNMTDLDISFRNDISYTIDLNGRTLGLKPTSCVFNTYVDKTFKIMNGTLNIDGSAEAADYLFNLQSGGAGIVFDNVTLNITGVSAKPVFSLVIGTLSFGNCELNVNGYGKVFNSSSTAYAGTVNFTDTAAVFANPASDSTVFHNVSANLTRSSVEIADGGKLLGSVYSGGGYFSGNLSVADRSSVTAKAEHVCAGKSVSVDGSSSLVLTGPYEDNTTFNSTYDIDINKLTVAPKADVKLYTRAERANIGNGSSMSSGYYSFSVASHIPSGSGASQTENPKYVSTNPTAPPDEGAYKYLVTSNSECKIGDMYFAELDGISGAINYCLTNFRGVPTTIELCRDVELSGAVDFVAGTNIVLDTKNFKISGTTGLSGNLFRVYGTLKVTGNGKFLNTNSCDGIEVYDGGKLTVEMGESGSIRGTDHAIRGYSNNDGSSNLPVIDIISGNFYAYGNDSYAIVGIHSKLTINGGYFHGVTGALWLLTNGNTIINGGTFDGGSFVINHNDGTITVNEGSFRTHAGYDIYTESSDAVSEITVISGYFSGGKIKVGSANPVLMNTEGLNIIHENSALEERPASEAYYDDYRYRVTQAFCKVDNDDSLKMASINDAVRYIQVNKNGAKSTITMLNDVIYESDKDYVRIPSSVDIVLDLNGKNITGPAYDLFKVYGKLQIIGGGTLKCTNAAGAGNVIEVIPGATLVIDDANVISEGIYSTALDAVRYSGETENTTVIINGGSFTAAYALCFDDVPLTVNGGRFKSTTAATEILVGSDGNDGITVNGGYFANNVSTDYIANGSGIILNRDTATKDEYRYAVVEKTIPDGFIRITTAEQISYLVDDTLQRMENVDSAQTYNFLPDMYLVCGYNGYFILYDYRSNDYTEISDEYLAYLCSEPANLVFYKDAFPDSVKLFKADGNVIPYETLAAALSSSAYGDTVRLDMDVREYNLRINDGVTVDLNGHTVDGTQNGEGDKSVVFTAGSSTVTDDSKRGGGSIINGPAGAVNFSGAGILKNITISNCSSTGESGIVNCGNTGITIENCIFTDNSGGAVVNGKDIAVSNSQITGSNASGNGGAICCDGGTLTVNGCKIVDNCAQFGGGIYYNVENGTAEISGTVISRNTASESGGGIKIENGTLTLNNCTVSGNTAAGENGTGGGVYISEYSDIVLKGGTSVSGNTAALSGGGVYIEDGHVTFSGPAKINSNKSGPDNVPDDLLVIGGRYIKINSDLTGSEIYYNALNSDGSEAARTITETYIDKNPGAGLNDYFHYEGESFVQTWNETGREIALSYIVSLGSVCGDTSSVVTLTGGGIYLPGTSATVTAPLHKNYRFTAWYDGETKVSDERVYTFSVNKNTNLTAHFDPVNAFRLTVDPAYAEKVSVSGITGSGGVYDAAEGEAPTKVSVNYNEAQGETFLYWKDENNNKLSGSKSYTFMLVRDMMVSPVVFAPSSQTGIADVRFVLEEGNVLISAATVTVEDGNIKDQPQFPVAPSKLGQKFSAWVIGEGDDVTVSETADQAAEIIRTLTVGEERTIVVKLRYASIGETCTVTVKFIGVTHEDVVFSGITVGQAKNFTAGEVEGKTLRCWKDAKGKVLSYTPTCTVRPSGDITLTAEYGDSEASETDRPQIAVTDFTDFTDNGVNKIRITSSYVVPAGKYDSVVSTGILYSRGSGDNMVLGGDAKQYTSVLTSFNGNITINFVSGENAKFYAVGFVTVEKNGVQTTFYSERAEYEYTAH